MSPGPKRYGTHRKARLAPAIACVTARTHARPVGLPSWSAGLEDIAKRSPSKTLFLDDDLHRIVEHERDGVCNGARVRNLRLEPAAVSVDAPSYGAPIAAKLTALPPVVRCRSTFPLPIGNSGLTIRCPYATSTSHPYR